MFKAGKEKEIVTVDNKDFILVSDAMQIIAPTASNAARWFQQHQSLFPEETFVTSDERFPGKKGRIWITIPDGFEALVQACITAPRLKIPDGVEERIKPLVERAVAQGFTASPKILPRLVANLTGGSFTADDQGAPFALSPLPSEAPTFPPEGTQTPQSPLTSPLTRGVGGLGGGGFAPKQGLVEKSLSEKTWTLCPSLRNICANINNPRGGSIVGSISFSKRG